MAQNALQSTCSVFRTFLAAFYLPQQHFNLTKIYLSHNIMQISTIRPCSQVMGSGVGVSIVPEVNSEKITLFSDFSFQTQKFSMLEKKKFFN